MNDSVAPTVNASVGPTERPIEMSAGVSSKRERLWGIIGGAAGAVLGVGSALIAVYVEGASWRGSTSPYPAFFTRPHLLAYDLFLFGVLVAGAAFLIGAILAARLSRFPRTDASGAALAGAIMVLLSGVLFFTRLVAISAAR